MAKSTDAGSPGKSTTRNTPKLTVQINPHGPSQATLDAIAEGLLKLPGLRKRLHGTQYRLLSITSDVSEGEEKSSHSRTSSHRFRATIYDYSNNVTLFIDGDVDAPAQVEISESSSQPLPSPAEFREITDILSRNPELGSAIRENRLRLYPPMPPLLESHSPDGRSQRIITVGLLPEGGGAQHEIVGVNMTEGTVARFNDRAPATALGRSSVCGVDYVPQDTARSVAGQVWITIKQGNTTLWKFLAVRPAASSGTNGSGVELRFVDYRGKRVLYRAHVPILNVKYERDACGPYRDWQNQEGMIQADGRDVAPGFRLCTSPAKTILDTGSDTGNFLGTAIYVDGLEVVLVCEMEAGWYRYVSEWRFHADGTIRPRFGFSAVSSSCVCNVHHHHVYWRLDFDIRTAGNNRVREFNDPPITGSSKWHEKKFEIKRPRDPARKRKWRVENTRTGEGYDIIPGHHDGTAAKSPDWPFPKGDVWILRYHGSELDDGSVAVGPPYEAEIDRFVNGEAINNHDVVIWYGAHFTHDIASEPPGSHGHIVGPELKPVKW